MSQPEAAPAPAGLLHAWQQRARQWSPTTRGLLWSAGAGILFCVLNASMRGLTQKVEPLQAQFLRYFFGFLVLLPVVFARGWRNYGTQSVKGHLWRGAMQTAGLLLWFMALPRIPLADMTAIGFTAPIFIMIGARIFLAEPMRWERWVAVVLGFAGVMLVVGPRLSGDGGLWHLAMLASAPLFAASFLLTKALTRHENTGSILVWQNIVVAVISLPMALWAWQPLSAPLWLGFMACGLLGSGGHYCLTRSFRIADISATQSAKFLELLWSAALGFMLFGDVPTGTTLAGGVVIAAATLWVARREGQTISRHPAARKAE
jgi:drug/metabolite transporter (DMT)-like permease